MSGGDSQSPAKRFEQYDRLIEAEISMAPLSRLAICFADIPVSADRRSSDKPMSCPLVRTAWLSSWVVDTV